MKNFENLLIWKWSMALAKNIYILTSKFPKEELYGISSQMKRASVSIP
jgi:four helix bundle protein